MEQFEYRDLTWELFTRTFARGDRFGEWAGAGIVLQAYLREADAHAEALVGFAEARGVPFQVRLVKGAYRDYETIVAEAAGWTPLVRRVIENSSQAGVLLAGRTGAAPEELLRAPPALATAPSPPRCTRRTGGVKGWESLGGGVADGTLCKIGEFRAC